MERDSFIFYRSFFEAISEIEDDPTRLEALEAIISYGLYGAEPEVSNPIARMVFKMAKPQLEANYKRFVGGRKGGRPKKEPEDIETENHRFTDTETIGVKKEKPNVNVNVNENVNVNGNEKEVKGEEAPPTPTLKKRKEEPIRFPSGEFMNVLLSADEQSKLVERYGHKVTDEYVNKLSGYMKSKGVKYKDHYATILNWIRKDNVPEKNTQAYAGSDLLARAVKLLGGTSA